MFFVILKNKRISKEVKLVKKNANRKLTNLSGKAALETSPQQRHQKKSVWRKLIKDRPGPFIFFLFSLRRRKTQENNSKWTF